MKEESAKRLRVALKMSFAYCGSCDGRIKLRSFHVVQSFVLITIKLLKYIA